MAKYRLGFTFVGENLGSYIVSEANVNGKVYQWVAPGEDGSFNGSYEPVVLLVTPKKKQLITIGGVSGFKWFNAGYELAVSNSDINTFSGLDSKDNTGYVLKLNLAKKNKRPGSSMLDYGVNYEFTDKYFSPIERFRSSEFNRDWNLENGEAVSQHLASLFAEYKYKKNLSSYYKASIINQQNNYNANRNELLINYQQSGNKLHYKGSLVNTASNLNTTAFFRHRAEAAKEIRRVKLGVINQIENNKWNDKNTDSLLANSFSFNQWETYLQKSDSLKSNYFLSYKIRQDFQPSFVQNNLTHTTKGEDLNIGFNLIHNPQRILKSSLSYRKLAILDTSLTNVDADKSLLARIESKLKFFKGAINSTSMYEFGSGLESIKEYAFVEVDRGLGIYIWQDYNINNVQELEEFEIASYKDTANYIRVQLPGNYVKVYNTAFSQVLNLKPGRSWYKKEGILKVLSRFSEQFAYRVSSKTKSEDLWKNLNPFQVSGLENEIVTLAYSMKNTLFFNRTNPIFGADYTINRNYRKNLLLSGYNSQESFIHNLRIRWNINQKLSMTNNVKANNKIYLSESYSSKNYNLNEIENKYGIDYLPSLSLRVSLSYLYREKENIGDERANENNLGAEFKYNLKEKGNLVFQLNYLNLNFTGETNSPLAYEMLQGFLPGNNFIWVVQYQQQLANSLQLNFNYNGRKLPDSNTLHAGGVQLRAFF